MTGISSWMILLSFFCGIFGRLFHPLTGYWLAFQCVSKYGGWVPNHFVTIKRGGTWKPKIYKSYGKGGKGYKSYGNCWVNGLFDPTQMGIWKHVLGTVSVLLGHVWLCFLWELILFLDCLKRFPEKIKNTIDWFHYRFTITFGSQKIKNHRFDSLTL